MGVYIGNCACKRRLELSVPPIVFPTQLSERLYGFTQRITLKAGLTKVACQQVLGIGVENPVPFRRNPS